MASHDSNNIGDKKPYKWAFDQVNISFLWYPNNLFTLLQYFWIPPIFYFTISRFLSNILSNCVFSRYFDICSPLMVNCTLSMDDNSANEFTTE